jgi:predicted TIM-barrel fold metal-dependent hydrolase
MRIIDFHTHAFPDALAARAVPALEKQGNVRAVLDGTVSALLRSMDRAGIQTSVVCSIATRPDQFPAILRWSRAVASDRLVPLASIHPADPDPAGKADAVAGEGLKGIKLHPYFQDFDLDEERVFPLYERIEQLGLLLVSHAGFDFAYPRVRRAEPARLLKVLQRFPRLRVVATHLGAWQDWQEVRRLLLGRPIPLEISCSLEFLPADEARDLILGHPADCLLFGTDSPWNDQTAALARLRGLGLPADVLEHMLHRNGAALLGMA